MRTTNVNIYTKAVDDIRELPFEVMESILSRLKGLEENPVPEDARNIGLDETETYLIRSSGYRIAYAYYREDNRIVVLFVEEDFQI